MPKLRLSNNLEMNYKDIGQGNPIILVHGTPSSSDEFQSFIELMQNKFRLIACDHIGFGESDKPSNYSYQLTEHQKNFNEFMTNLNLTKFNIIIHDFGGIIALPYILDNLHKVSNLVISNSWAWKMSSVEFFPPWMRFLMSRKLTKFLYIQKNFSARFFVKLAWGTYAPLTNEMHEQFLSKFKLPDERYGTWGFAQALVNESDTVWEIEKQLNKLNGTNVLLLWGSADRLITLKSFYNWQKLLPHTKEKCFASVGHFLFAEAPQLCAEAVDDFVK